MSAIGLIRPYFYRHRFRIAVGVLCLVVVDVLQLLIPRVVKHAVDDLTLHAVDLAGLRQYAFVIIGLAILIGCFRYVWRRCLIGTSRVIEKGLRNQLFEHIQSLSPAYFDRTKSGDIMAHATNDINHIRMASGMGMVALTDAIFMGTAAIGFMLYISIDLTLLVLIPMPLIAFGARIFSRKMHRRYGAVQAAFSDLTEAVRERLTGIRVIKGYLLESASHNLVGRESGRYIDANLRLIRVTGAFFPMMMFFANTSMMMVVYFGGIRTIRADITPGDFVAFISYLGLLTWPMMAMGWVTNLIQRGRASLDRIHAIMETRPDIVAPTLSQARQLERVDTIEFKNALFAYPSGNGRKPDVSNALDGLTFRIRRGETLGIVGPPGSGKTTLSAMIPRLYDLTSGSLLINGHDIREYDLTSLRRQIAYMPQEPFLLAGTIRENIRLFNPDLTGERIAWSSNQAALDKTLQGFPDGIDTVVGEKGVLLSGGQKQRVTLSRALLPDASVLILDDPISQVDVDTGRQIIDNIRRMTGDRILIIVSHRLSALQFADRILSLDKGRIVESGSHDSLLDRGGYYARTWQIQEIEEDLDA